MPGHAVSASAVGVAAFLLYSNLPVVLAQTGLIPSVAAVAVPALLFATVAHGLVVRREPIAIDRTLLLMACFLAWLLASALASRAPEEAASRIAAYGAEGLLTFALVRNAVQSLPALRHAVVGVALGATLLAALALVQTFTGDYEQTFWGLAQRNPAGAQAAALGANGPVMGLDDRAQGPVGDANRFAQILLMAWPLALVSYLNARTRRGRLLAWAAVAALLGGVVVTYSRGAFLTLVILALLTVSFRLVRARGLFTLLAVGVLLVPWIAPGYVGRVASISGATALLGNSQVEADGPIRGRTTEMLSALAAFVDHPVLGVGPGQYLAHYSVEYQALPEISIRELAEPRRAHSLYFEMAAETGALGLALFLAIPLLLLRDLRTLGLRLQADRPELARLAAAFMLVVLAYLGTGVFLHLAFERYYWFMIGLSAAAAGILHRAAREADAEAMSAWRRDAPSW
jgi:O-antigen ligase